MAYSAITAAVAHEITNNGRYILITDETTYRTGGNTPTRGDCLVNFLVEEIVNGIATDITPNYDPATVTSILVPISADGWYRVTETITGEEGFSPEFSTQAVLNILVTDRYCQCWTDKAYNVFLKSTCGCEENKAIAQLIVMDAQFKGIERMVATNDMASAAKALERLGLTCAAFGCDCGC